jgi:hypothetical protein
VEDAIASQDTQPKRQQLSQWWEQKKPVPIVELVKPSTVSQCQKDDIQFCLRTLAELEAPDHPSISTQEELVALFNELEAREEKCGERLPNDFWKRATLAVGYISESFEKPQTQLGQSFEVGLTTG